MGNAILFLVKYHGTLVRVVYQSLYEEKRHAYQFKNDITPSVSLYEAVGHA